MDLRATLSACTSGTPALSSVPSIRQKRAMANWLNSGPSTGTRRMNPSQARRPFSDATQLRTRKPTTTSPIADENAVVRESNG